MSNAANTAHSAATLTGAISAFIMAAQKASDVVHASQAVMPVVMLSKPGKKFVRVYTDRGGLSGKSSYCFIELATGNILKAAGWKAPAKGVRGNVMTATLQQIENWGYSVA